MNFSLVLQVLQPIPQAPQAPSPGSLNIPAIVGGVIGGFVVNVILLVVLWYFYIPTWQRVPKSKR